jgi:hypothetical protein
MSLFIRKSALSWSLAMALPAVAFGQTGYTTNGGEYLIAGSLPGDQTHPQLGLSASGGYLVWEDNGVNPREAVSIRAVGLDSTFSEAGVPFRVNQNSRGYEERPAVALLNSGGAVFVWQGGSVGFQRIYGRFLSSSNTWLGGEMRISSPTNNFQVNPAITTLTNGNVVVAWDSYNQFSSSSMRDVYVRIFTPDGRTNSAEFLANEFTSYNQRTPALAALSDGRFLLAWVSEQQRDASHNSVDIYARLFASDGTPASHEFLVNTSTNVCANPTVAAASNGGFAIGWSEKDLGVQTNGWDVMARTFSQDAVGGLVRVGNTYRYGDQFGPRISALGTNYLMIWTSLVQDGSWEGVYGQFLNGDGSLANSEFRVNTTTINKQMEPAVASDNSGRFLAVWTGFNSLSSGFDLYGQVYSVSGFVAPPVVAGLFGTPTETYPDLLASGATITPTGGDNGSGIDQSLPLLTYPVSASFALPGLSDGLTRAQGSYNGLFLDSTGVSVQSSGFFTATLTKKGYSARILLGNHGYSVSGHFDSQGYAANTFRRGGKLSPLGLQLQVDLNGGDQIRGSIVNTNGWTAEILADRRVFTRSNPWTKTGSYTLVILPDESSATGPDGYGYGTLKVDVLGNLSWSGSLADGTKVTQKSAVSKQGTWPLAVSLYSGAGTIISWMQFTNNTDGDPSGLVAWIKPANASPKAKTQVYSNGFTNEVWALGSIYAAPSAKQQVMGLTNSMLIFSGGSLAGSHTNTFTLGLNNRVSASAPTNSLKLTFTPSTGLFKGSIVEESKKLSFQGALFENGQVGVGYFLDSGESGEVYLSPAQ